MKQEALEHIAKIIRAECPKAVGVTVFVNAYDVGVTVRHRKPDGYAMKSLDGEWVEENDK